MKETTEARSGADQLRDWGASRLRRHKDYQRVYGASRKQHSGSMAFFFAPRSDATADAPARVGLTAGRVLGKAVERNRIKRRMREVVRRHVDILPPGVDVVLHPRKSVMTMGFADLDGEVGEVFARIARQVAKRQPGREPVAGDLRGDTAEGGRQ